MTEPLDTWTVTIDANTEPLQKELAAAAGFGRQFSRSLTTAFSGVALQGKDLGQVFNTLALSLSRMTLQAAFKPFEQAVGGLFANLLTGGASAGAFAFANGGVIQRGMPVPFAAGGVISSPVAFPLNSGAMGVAGERGAEAILPLARGPDGRLGVKAGGAGGGVAVTFNVTTPDADSFRRTEQQLAAMLARAVGHGQRNL